MGVGGAAPPAPGVTPGSRSPWPPSTTSRAGPAQGCGAAPDRRTTRSHETSTTRASKRGRSVALRQAVPAGGVHDRLLAPHGFTLQLAARLPEPGTSAAEAMVDARGEESRCRVRSRLPNSRRGRCPRCWIGPASGWKPTRTHQDRRLAEEIREAAGDLVNRIGREGSTARPSRIRVARGPGRGPARRVGPGPPGPGREGRRPADRRHSSHPGPVRPAGRGIHGAPRAVELLALLGTDCVTLANNHTLDYGVAAAGRLVLADPIGGGRQPGTGVVSRAEDGRVGLPIVSQGQSSSSTSARRCSSCARSPVDAFFQPAYIFGVQPGRAPAAPSPGPMRGSSVRRVRHGALSGRRGRFATRSGR